PPGRAGGQGAGRAAGRGDAQAVLEDPRARRGGAAGGDRAVAPRHAALDPPRDLANDRRPPRSPARDGRDHGAAASGARLRPCRDRPGRSEEHTSELQSRGHLVCRLLLEKKKKTNAKDRSLSRWKKSDAENP